MDRACGWRTGLWKPASPRGQAAPLLCFAEEADVEEPDVDEPDVEEPEDEEPGVDDDPFEELLPDVLELLEELSLEDEPESEDEPLSEEDSALAVLVELVLSRLSLR